MRSIFEALGIKDIVAKSVGSSNPHNMIKSTFSLHSRRPAAGGFSDPESDENEILQ